ncbi:MAG: endonuclease/exonuclease/phosphatase family protein [Opitutaceae bacterium]
MPKAFSVASWNVEHFKNVLSRVDDVVALLANLKPDVFSLYEVEGKDVFGELVNRMPGYQFHITEGPQVQEILVGVRSGLTAFFTQKIEFRSGASAMRPGSLLTVTTAGESYPILFLHLASGPDPRGWGLRDDMLERALDFRKTLQKGAADPAKPVNYLFLGDLNTMGMEYLFKAHNILADVELKKIEAIAKKQKMRTLTKNKPHTWSNGSLSRLKPSNLDHVVAAAHLQFKQFNGADVRVLGWPEEPTPAAQDEWIKRFSDHGILYFEVQRV